MGRVLGAPWGLVIDRPQSTRSEEAIDGLTVTEAYAKASIKIEKKSASVSTPTIETTRVSNESVTTNVVVALAENVFGFDVASALEQVARQLADLGNDLVKVEPSRIAEVKAAMLFPLVVFTIQNVRGEKNVDFGQNA
ncbi:hypothetical protein [Schlesneria sp. DSM 10557]|uniref:hypothetical protein n=1 Tax=Schlesneria sp. DSM 10557 TaxID=3044399 RepID=UPI0035A1593B